MKTLLQAEEAAQLAIAILALYVQPISIPWWIWPFLFLSPDISMLGYLVNNRIGAISYNLFHHKLTGIALTIAGYFLHGQVLMFIGILLFAHSCFDRVFGYGLKFSDDFKHTHLGHLGKVGKE